MSYDVSFRVKVEGADDSVRIIDGNDDYGYNYGYNYTYNLTQAMREASPNKDFDLYDMNGKTGAEVMEAIEPIITEFCFNAKAYKQYEPKNGWGDIEGCRQFLLNIYDVCNKYPSCILEVH